MFKCVDAVKLIGLSPDGGPVLGVTTLDKNLYVWYGGQHRQRDIVIYDTDTLTLQRQLTVRGLSSVTDMASCSRFKCIYIADWNRKVIHRVDETSGEQSQLNVQDKPHSLSVNSDYDLIVTCDAVSKIKVFTTYGVLIKIIESKASEFVHPLHAIQVSIDKYMVSHDEDDSLHRVLIVDGRGRVHQSFGGSKGSKDDQLNAPIRLSVVKNDLILVADLNNRRLVMLNSTLRFVKYLASFGGVGAKPCRMWFDEQTDRLYVAVNKWSDELSYIGGHVEVYSIVC